MLYAQAIEYGYRNQFVEAEKVLTRIIASNPKDSMAYFDRGIMRENIGDTLGAIADFTKQISLDKKNADSYFLRGILYHKTKQYQFALSDFQKVIRLDYGNADAHFFKAQLLQVLGKSPLLMQRQLRICLQIDPQHEGAKEMHQKMTEKHLN